VPEVAAISSRFDLVRLLGEGGMGVVYEAVDRQRGARVALKTLRRFTPEGLARFKREFRALEGVHHRNLVQLGELISEGGQWFFTMELVDGVDFLNHVRPWHRERLSAEPPVSALVSTVPRAITEDAPIQPDPSAADTSGPAPSDRELPSFDVERLREALSELARGLVALHEANCVHRDVKPSNIRVTKEGRVVLLDFGIVGELETGFPLSEQSVAGTPAYMAPEQALFGTVAPAADWYSVGVLLYEAMTGQLPFEGAPLLILKQKQMGAPQSPSSFVSNLPEDLEQLCLDLLRPEPDLRPAGSDVLRRLGSALSSGHRALRSPSSAPNASPLVGRSQELRSLRQAFEEGERTRTLAMIVCGESGIGKTLLVREFTSRLASERHDVLLLRGRCHEREEVPYKALDDVIDQLGRRLARLSDSAVAALAPVRIGALMRVFPVLQRVHALKREAESQNEADALEPRELRRQAFIALRELLARLGRHRRIVLVVDDLQWADADSIALLGDLLRPPDAAPILFLATARTLTDQAGTQVEPRALIETLPGHLRPLQIHALPVNDARELAARLIQASGSRDNALAATIATEGAGHPLFMAELARQATRDRAFGALKLDEALWARALRLDDATRQLLETVVVAGLPTPQHIVADAASVAPSEFFSRVNVLRAAHFVRTTGTRFEDPIEVYHDRVRESVILHLCEESRRERHRRIATALERAGGADAESLAIHWHEAGDLARAAEHSTKAAEHAAASLAFDRAARLYKLAAQLRPADARAFDIKRVEALSNAGRLAEAARVRLALALDAEPNEALDLRRRAAEQYMCCGHFNEGLALLRENLAAVSIRFLDFRPALLVALIFFRTLLRVRGTAFRERDPARIDRRVVVRIETMRSAFAGFAMQDPVRALYFLTRTTLLALGVGDVARIVYFLSLEICFLWWGDKATQKRAERLLQVANMLARSLGTAEALAVTSAAAGYARFWVCDWRGAREHLVRAEELLCERCIGMTHELNSFRLTLQTALVNLGDLRELGERARPLLHEVDELGNRYSSINVRAAALAIVGLAADDPDGVERQLREAEAWLAPGRFHLQHFYLLMARAQVELYRGETLAASSRIRAHWRAVVRSMLLRIPMLRIQAIDSRARALVACVRDDAVSRKELLHLAAHDARRLERERMPWPEGCAHMIRGAIASIEGDSERALSHVIAAAHLFTEAGMELHGAAARYRRGELLGGDEGASLIRDASQWMSTQRVINPKKMTALMAPGFH
jgi:serine/threonine protein kinase